VHPEEARSRGLADGARVRLGNRTGAITLQLAVSADVPRGSFSPIRTANGAESNINAVNPGKKADLAESSAVHSINVSVAPA
jgi:anaerobic selenocysteine-containing dehydrogenase